MAKIKFNVKGVEVRRGGGEPIPKGVYKCEIETCVVNKPSGKDQRIEVVYKVADGDQAGRKLWDYINLESEAAAFKVREFLEAVGVASAKKEVGEFDPGDFVGEEVSVRVVHQPDNRPENEGAMQHRVGGVMALDGSDDEEEEDLSDDEEAEAGSADDEEADDDDEEGDEVDLDELNRTELKALVKEHELDITVKRSMSDDDLRKAIAEALGSGTPDYESMDLEELRTTAKERGLKTTGSKKLLVARLTKSDEENDDEEPF